MRGIKAGEPNRSPFDMLNNTILVPWTEPFNNPVKPAKRVAFAQS
jgi:hypothetical protein